MDCVTSEVVVACSVARGERGFEVCLRWQGGDVLVYSPISWLCILETNQHLLTNSLPLPLTVLKFRNIRHSRTTSPSSSM